MLIPVRWLPKIAELRADSVAQALLSRAKSDAPTACLADIRGTLHVTALAADGVALRTINIGPHAPKSALDFFALNAARARAAAVLTSAGNLRNEGGHAVRVAGPHAGVLAAWRAALGIGAGGVAGLLTARGSIDPAWPFFRSAGAFQPLVLTTEEGEARLVHATADAVVERLDGRQPGTRRGLDVPVAVCGMASDAPGVVLRKAIALLQERAARRASSASSLSRAAAPVISVECGPTLTRTLYYAQDGYGPLLQSSECPIDALLLSVFHGRLDDRAKGHVLFRSAADVSRLFAPASAELREATADGVWSCQLWRRQGVPGGQAS